MSKVKLIMNKIKNGLFLSKNTERFFFILVCATLFTSGVCHWLLDLSYKYVPSQVDTLHIDFRIVFWVFVVISVYYLSREYLFKSSNIQFDFSLLILAQIMFFIGVLDYQKERYAGISYTWIIPMAYVIGKLIVRSNEKNYKQRITIVYFSLAIGLFVVTMLDFYNDYKLIPYYGGFQTGEWLGFWTGQGQNRCTMEYGLVMITSAIGFAIYNAKKNKKLFMFELIGCAMAQFYCYKTEGRENLLLFPLALTLFGGVYLYDNWSSCSYKLKKRFLYTVIIIFLIIIIGVIGFYTNFFGLYDKYNSSYLSDDGGIINNIRFTMDWNGFKAMLQYPLDDYETVANITPPHSMLLEYGRVYGLTIYLGLILFRLLIIKEAILLAFSRNVDYSVKYLLVSIFVCFNLYYSMEPNGFALRYIWMPGLLISGMIKGVNHVAKESI